MCVCVCARERACVCKREALTLRSKSQTELKECTRQAQDSHGDRPTATGSKQATSKAAVHEELKEAVRQPRPQQHDRKKVLLTRHIVRGIGILIHVFVEAICGLRAL